jgi:hypothetical protein
MSKWLSETDGIQTHVTPIDDLRPHDFDSECWCKPTDDEGIWVHHSMDRREEYEEGRLKS